MIASVGPLPVRGPVEVGQDVGGPVLQRPPEPDDLAQGGRDVVADGGDQPGHELTALGPVGFAVGGDHALIDGPGGFDLDVLIDGEQRVEACALLVGEQVAASVQDPPCAVEGVGGAAAVAVEVLLGAASAPVERVPARRTTWNGLCRRRHNAFYAEVLVMPMWSALVLVGVGVRAGEVGIIGSL